METDELPSDAKLNEFIEYEWLEIARIVRPDIPDEQHMKDIKEFLELKQLRSLN